MSSQDIAITVGRSVITMKTALRCLAAFIIQRCCKAYKKRKYIRILRDIERSAICIQKFWREILFRKHLAELRLYAQGNNINAVADVLTRGLLVNNYVAGKSPVQLTLRLVRIIEF